MLVDYQSGLSTGVRNAVFRNDVLAAIRAEGQVDEVGTVGASVRLFCIGTLY